MKRIQLLTVAAVTAVVLAACGKQVDAGSVGAEQVPGVSNLLRFCDGPTLVYYSDWDSTDDQYEWFWPGGCVYDGNKWVFGNRAPEGAPPNGDSTDDGK